MEIRWVTKFEQKVFSFSWETAKSTFMFNKVVRRLEWVEVENVYITYNLSHFVVYLPKIIKLMEIWRSSDRNNFAQIFLRHGVHNQRLFNSQALCHRAVTIRLNRIWPSYSYNYRDPSETTSLKKGNSCRRIQFVQEGPTWKKKWRGGYSSRSHLESQRVQGRRWQQAAWATLGPGWEKGGCGLCWSSIPST